MGVSNDSERQPPDPGDLEALIEFSERLFAALRDILSAWVAHVLAVWRRLHRVLFECYLVSRHVPPLLARPLARAWPARWLPPIDRILGGLD
jgi:hypothetical protein